MVFRVFVSYSSHDLATVNEVLDSFPDDDGLEFFIAEDSLPPGARFQDLREEIQACDAFVVFLSEAALASEWVPQEIALAVEHDKPFVPVLLDRVKVPGFAGGIKGVRFDGREHEAVQELYDVLSAMKRRRNRNTWLLGAGAAGLLLWLGRKKPPLPPM